MADGEFFDLDLQEISLIGTPWHGKVQSSVLTLPNATTKAYPQPSDKATRLDTHDASCTYYDAALAGTCHVIKVPGVLAVTRSAEQEAADTAAGYQWKTSATLSGGRLQLYGKELKGWIYVDPAGDRWLVTCPAFWPYPHLPANAKTEPLAATVRLTRFGVIPMGGAAPTPEHHDYAVSLAAGWLTSYSAATYIHPTIDAVSRTGDKAAIGMHTGFGEVEGYLQLAIAGAGSDATLTLSVLRTYAQCAEATQSGASEGGIYDELQTASAAWSFSRLHALWYDDQGAVVEVRVVGAGNYVWSLVRDFGAGTSDYSYVGEATISVSLDGSDVDVVSLSAECTESGESSVFTGESSLTIGQESFSETWERETSYVGRAMVEAYLMAGATVPNTQPDGVMPYATTVYTAAMAVGRTVFLWAICHSRHCVGLWTKTEVIGNPTPVYHGRPAATPAGVMGDVVELAAAPSAQRRRDSAPNPSGGGWTSNNAYGAWDPFSGAVTLWQSSPVCCV